MWDAKVRASAVICRCFTDSGAEREDFIQNLSNIEPKRAPKTTQMEPKGYQNEARNLQRHLLRNRVEKKEKRGRQGYIFWVHFVEQSLNKNIFF
jgi:hypothetical protein